MFKACIFTIFFVLFPFLASADCSFKTGEFIEKLHDPSEIEFIKVDIPKSARWTKNFLKIINSREKNISPNFKKYFYAKIFVKYKFGSCIFTGTVRQSGDYKDHISFKDGQPVQSVDIKLKNGNIVNSVHFKLLIPETRNNLKEIFAGSLLSSIGFITPETFKVSVEVNGVKNEMIFQEGTEKELLERNKRREGPMFEGDESLLWGAGRLWNDDLSLARLVNKSWFMKGPISQKITLESYKKLQMAFVIRSNNIKGMGDYIDPNKFVKPYSKDDSIFPKYHFIMQALGAEHGLIPHNRKFYFNVFENYFEPIYYDGNVFQDDATEYSQQIIRYSYNNFNYSHFASTITSQEIRESAFQKFEKRGNSDKNTSKKVFATYWGRFEKNVEYLKSQIKRTEIPHVKLVSNKVSYAQFIARASAHPITELLVLTLKQNTDGTFRAILSDGESYNLSDKEVAKMISRNSFRKRHATFVDNEVMNGIRRVYRIPFLNGQIIHSPGMKLEIDEKNHKINFFQQDPMGWAYITDASLANWIIDFEGNSGSAVKKLQRFNNFGMTGCLNFHNSDFNHAQIFVRNGTCEDSLNIVKSTGSISKIEISTAYADAIDLDFANLEIFEINVNGSGNDCLDVSSGVYSVEKASLTSCGDKGVSVGEASSFKGEDFEIDGAHIGISSKDLSNLEISNVTVKKALTCIEALQKKQEFGGSSLIINKLNCEGSFNIDEQSVFTREKL